MNQACWCDMQVDASAFQKEEEKALWSAYLEAADKIHPGTQAYLHSSKRQASYRWFMQLSSHVLCSPLLQASTSKPSLRLRCCWYSPWRISSTTFSSWRWAQIYAFQDVMIHFIFTVKQTLYICTRPLCNWSCSYLVMAHEEEDERTRNNRLALLQKVASLTKGIADLSVLPGF